jgi:hypothetical protein
MALDTCLQNTSFEDLSSTAGRPVCLHRNVAR